MALRLGFDAKGSNSDWPAPLVVALQLGNDAAAEWLIAQKYTAKSRLGILGRSNGGLLVGTALTQRPDLFRCVVCGVPLLDMVRYHKFLVVWRKAVW